MKFTVVNDRRLFALGHASRYAASLIMYSNICFKNFLLKCEGNTVTYVFFLHGIFT